jgi:hypothetical protein
MGEKSNTYRILAGKPKEMRTLQRQKYSWVDNIKMDLR